MKDRIKVNSKIVEYKIPTRKEAEEFLLSLKSKPIIVAEEYTSKKNELFKKYIESDLKEKYKIKCNYE